MGYKYSLLNLKGDSMSVLPATVGGLSAYVPVDTVRRALDLVELSGSDSISITISLERLLRWSQTVSCLVGQQLDAAVGHENMSSDEEPGAGSENSGGGGFCFGDTPCEPRGRSYLLCRDIFLLQNAKSRFIV